MAETPEQFAIAVPDRDLADLDDRLARTRWAPDIANEDWRYGTPRSYLEPFVATWRSGYDWREHERAMNRHDHFRVTIDDVPVHFVYRRGTGPDPIPLVLSHGWPWTFWDLIELVGPLADPAAHGGDSADSFDVVVPSLPGFGFSTPLERPGVGSGVVAEVWRTLMIDVLGYERFGAQGSDFGAIVTQRLAQVHPEVLLGVHLSRYKRPAPGPGVGINPVKPEDYGPDEEGDYERTMAAGAVAASHLAVHTHDPQSLAYGLHDSPVGLAAWLLERRRNWSDCGGDVERAFTREHLITTTMLYWLTGSIGSSIRLYWESAREPQAAPPAPGRRVIDVPTAIGVLPHDVIALPKRHAEEDTDLRHWTRFPRGGHFGPAEVPDLYVEDLRAFFRPLRTGR